MNFNEVYEDTITSVSQAVRTGNIEQLRRLIESGRAMTTGDNRGWRPIHFAADLGRKDCLDLLVDKDDCNVRTFEGQTPLLLACESLDKRRSMVTDVRKVIRCLLKRDDVDVNIGDHSESTPLHAAAKAGDDLVVKWLIRRGANVNAVNAWRQIPLHCAIESRHDDEGVNVEYLIKHGSNLQHRDENQLTPLSAAILESKSNLVQIILNQFETGSFELKRYVNLRAKIYTPLMIAAAKPNLDIVTNLLDSGADPNAVTRCMTGTLTPLHVACQESEGKDLPDVIHKLVDVTDPNVLEAYCREPNNVSPYKLAMTSFNWSGLKILIESRLVADKFLDEVDIWPQNLFYQFATPLATFLNANWMTNYSNDEMVQLFTRRGSDVNGNSHLPPILSSHVKGSKVVQILIDFGAIVPNRGLLVLAAHPRSVQTAITLTKHGAFHPESLLNESNLEDLEKMFTAAEPSKYRQIAAGVTTLVTLLYYALGSDAKQENFLKYQSILVRFCIFPLGPVNDAFGEISRKLLSSPSSLKSLSRNVVRRQLLLSNCRCENLHRRINEAFSTTLPSELRLFLVFSDIDETILMKLCESLTNEGF